MKSFATAMSRKKIVDLLNYGIGGSLSLTWS